MSEGQVERVRHRPLLRCSLASKPAIGALHVHAWMWRPNRVVELWLVPDPARPDWGYPVPVQAGALTADSVVHAILNASSPLEAVQLAREAATRT